MIIKASLNTPKGENLTIITEDLSSPYDKPLSTAQISNKELFKTLNIDSDITMSELENYLVSLAERISGHVEFNSTGMLEPISE